jgi:hypothetical protein
MDAAMASTVNHLHALAPVEEKLQSKFSADIEFRRHAALVARYAELGDALSVSRMEILCQKHTSHWLCLSADALLVIPGNMSALWYTDAEFGAAISLRLGRAVYPEAAPCNMCRGAGWSDQFGHHALSCGSGGERSRASKRLCMAVEAVARLAGRTVTSQPMPFAGSALRPDFMTVAGTRLDVVDGAITYSLRANPTSYERQKVNKYQHLVDIEVRDRHRDMRLVPLVASTDGAWGTAGLAWIKQLSADYARRHDISKTRAQQMIFTTLSTVVNRSTTTTILRGYGNSPLSDAIIAGRQRRCRPRGAPPVEASDASRCSSSSDSEHAPSEHDSEDLDDAHLTGGGNLAAAVPARVATADEARAAAVNRPAPHVVPAREIYGPFATMDEVEALDAEHFGAALGEDQRHDAYVPTGESSDCEEADDEADGDEQHAAATPVVGGGTEAAPPPPAAQVPRSPSTTGTPIVVVPSAVALGEGGQHSPDEAEVRGVRPSTPASRVPTAEAAAPPAGHRSSLPHSEGDSVASSGSGGGGLDGDERSTFDEEDQAHPTGATTSLAPSQTSTMDVSSSLGGDGPVLGSFDFASVLAQAPPVAAGAFELLQRPNWELPAGAANTPVRPSPPPRAEIFPARALRSFTAWATRATQSQSRPGSGSGRVDPGSAAGQREIAETVTALCSNPGVDLSVPPSARHAAVHAAVAANTTGWLPRPAAASAAAAPPPPAPAAPTVVSTMSPPPAAAGTAPNATSVATSAGAPVVAGAVASGGVVLTTQTVGLGSAAAVAAPSSHHPARGGSAGPAGE